MKRKHFWVYAMYSLILILFSCGSNGTKVDSIIQEALSDAEASEAEDITNQDHIDSSITVYEFEAGDSAWEGASTAGTEASESEYENTELILNSQDSVIDDLYVDLNDGPIFISDFHMDALEKSFTLSQYNLITGDMKEVFRLPYLSTSQNLHCGDLMGGGKTPLTYMYRALFNNDLSKCAIQFYKNGGYHVGWVDEKGNLFDFSELYHPTGTGFTSTAPDDWYPSFTPKGLFLFVDKKNKQSIWADPNTLEVVDTKPALQDKTMGYILDVYEGYDGITEVGAYNGIAHNGDFIPYDLSPMDVTYGILYSYNMKEGYSNRIAKKNEEESEPIVITPESEFGISRLAYHDGKIFFEARRDGAAHFFVMDDADGVSDNITEIEIPQNYTFFFW